jgi:hypothetical protein
MLQGMWFRVYGVWCTISSFQFVVNGVNDKGCVVKGVWCIVYGVRCMISGFRFVVVWSSAPHLRREPILLPRRGRQIVLLEGSAFSVEG